MRRTDVDWLLNIFVPAAEALLRLISREEKAFVDALVKLLDLRREYLSRPPKGLVTLQHVSVEGLGLVAWARTQGFAVPVESPYLPPALTDVTPRELVACAACLTPLESSPSPCPACGREPTDDELRFELGEWLSLDRDPCRTCTHGYPLVAQTCPVCLTPRSNA